MLSATRATWVLYANRHTLRPHCPQRNLGRSRPCWDCVLWKPSWDWQPQWKQNWSNQTRKQYDPSDNWHSRSLEFYATLTYLDVSLVPTVPYCHTVPRSWPRGPKLVPGMLIIQPQSVFVNMFLIYTVLFCPFFEHIGSLWISKDHYEQGLLARIRIVMHELV